jgi:hypothetical protein
VDGISDVVECSHGLLVVHVYESFFMYQIESGWVGLCRGVGRGYLGVTLTGGGGQEEGVGGCGWAGVTYRYIEYKVSVLIAYL